MADITQVQLSDTFAFLVDRLNEAIARSNALGDQAAVSVTGGAISGVTIGSSSINSTPIGSSSPATGRFTSLSLDTPLAVTQGGTGATTAVGARTSLGFANASNLTEGVLDDDRIPNLSAGKITDGTFTVGDFSSDLSLTKSGAAKIAAKGTGSSEVYSYLSLESDESEDKGWQIFHRKDNANRLSINYNLTQVAAYFDPTTRGLVVGSTTSGGSPATGSINAKSYYVDGVKISDAATVDLAGIIELATNAEAVAGSDASRAVTPAALTAVIADRIATSGEAIALTSTTELITPATFAAIFGNSTARETLKIITDIEPTSTNANFYPTLAASNTGDLFNNIYSSTVLYFNPSTGRLHSTEFQTLSDENKKKDIMQIDNALETVLKLHGKKFKWKNNDSPSVGLIAQEVEKHIPEIISNDGDNKTINYNGIIGFLVEAVKELSEKIIKIQEEKITK